MATFTGTIPTFAAGDNATVVANLNLFRDALKALADPWTSYTPTWTAATSNPVLGNGSFAGSAYQQVGKFVNGRIVLTMGGTTTYGTGQWRLTLPVTPANTSRQSWIFDMFDNGTGAYTGKAVWSSAGYLALACEPTTAGNADRAVGTGVPFAWASTDQVVIPFTYEAA